MIVQLLLAALGASQGVAAQTSLPTNSFSCLFQLPPNANTAADYAVTNLPNATSSLLATLNGQYAGYIPTSTNPSAPNNLFFWYFPSSNPASTSLVIWLNGGPGCSSLFGSFLENGPLHANGSTLVPNPNSWHHEANMLYIEQPLGTGFSQVSNTSGEPSTEYQVGSQFVAFLNGFYNVFKNASTWDLYLTGESYAGTYIPYIGAAIQHCKTLVDGKTLIPLKGLGISDGVLDFDIQESSTAAVNEYDYLNTIGFFNRPGAAAGLQSKAAAMAGVCRDPRFTGDCDVIGLVDNWYTLNYDQYGKGTTCIDIYNIDYSVPCGDSVDQFFAVEADLAKYLNTPQVRAAIHVDPILNKTIPGSTWQECSTIAISLYNDATGSPSSATFLPALVASGVKVLIFNGDLDLIVNFVGVEQAIGNLTWGGAKGFQNPSIPWTINGTTAGLYSSERGLTYVRVQGAGHMVAADQPVSGLALLQELLSDRMVANVVANGGVGSIGVAPVSVVGTKSGGVGRWVGWDGVFVGL
ncbi:Cell death protease [Podochytrium sp. JEL0797]|nr:Cell death protease [Podochytrium sp. JEL0797]